MKKTPNLIRTDSLSGNRIPLAFHTLERQLYETARHSPLVRPADEGVPELLQFFSKNFDAPNLEAVVDSCATHLNLDWDETTSGTLLASLYRTLLHEDDTEGYVVTTGFFVRMIEPEIARMEARRFVIEVIRRYLRSIRHLYPVLSGYANVALHLSSQLRDAPCYLFLRDALVFWPSLLCLREQMGNRKLHFVIYTRSLSKERLPPLIFEETSHGIFQLAPGSRINGVLVDVGLYGTLVQRLERDGYLEKGSSVYFLGSRNPGIPAFLNQVLGASSEEGSELPEDVTRIVKCIDTVECLLKPFLISSLRINSHQTVLLGACDFISFVCFSAFCWDLQQFTRSHPFDEELVQSAVRAEATDDQSWHLASPIPAWNGANGFLKKWNAPSLVPSAEINQLYQKLTKRNKHDFA